VNAKNRRENDRKSNTRNTNTKNNNKQGFKPKKKARVYKINANGRFLKNFAFTVKEFLKNPVYTIVNPGAMTRGEGIAVIGLTGLVYSVALLLCMQGSVGERIILALTGVIGFGGADNITHTANVCLGIGVLTAWTYVQYFLFVTMIFLIQKFALRAYADYWDIARRTALTAVPFLTAGVMSLITGIFSVKITAFIAVAAAVISIILVYEMLKELWHGLLADRLIYIMSLTYFVYLIICVNIASAML
jgi:hypothetical protein